MYASERIVPSRAPPKPSCKRWQRAKSECTDEEGERDWQAEEFQECEWQEVKSQDDEGQADWNAKSECAYHDESEWQEWPPGENQGEQCQQESTHASCTGKGGNGWDAGRIQQDGWSYSQEGYQIKVEGSEAKLMLTMPGFVKWHISRMIGKRGSNLLEIARASGCKVHLCGRDSNRPTNEDNYLLIRGSKTRMEQALRIACQKVREVLGTDIPICDICGEDHKSRDCLQVRLPFVRKIFVNPRAKVGFIIGTGGRNVEPIKATTGALIRMCGIGAGELHANEPLHMRIECKTQEDLDTAVEMASSLIDRVTSWSPYDSLPPEGHAFKYRQKIILEMDAFREKFDSLNAHLLGQGGQHFRFIHDLTGAWLWLRGEGSCGFAGETGEAAEPLHLLIEHDDQSQLKEAVELAQELVDKVEARLIGTFCRECGGPHFTYRCSKANSAGYLKEMRSKGTGKGCDAWSYNDGKADWYPSKRPRYDG